MPTGYYNVSFLTHDNTGWNVNLSNVAGYYPGRGWIWGNSDDLLTCFKRLQQGGAKILLSFGGYLFQPPDEMRNPSYVSGLAEAIAYSFLGSPHKPRDSFVDWQPAFSDWHFDGIDLHLDQSACFFTYDVPGTWLNFSKCIKKFAPGTILTGSPQSSFLHNTNIDNPFGAPFPGRSADTCGSVSEPEPGEFLLSTDNLKLFDALFVQFYNQYDKLEFPGEANFEARFCQLKKLVCSSVPAPKFFVGVASEKQGMNGKPPGNYDACTIGDAVNSALGAAGGSCTSEWFGGVMGWQSPGGIRLVQDILTKTGGSGALYGYQAGEPGW